MEQKRQRWKSRWAFVLAAIGSAAGLGNAWRFPYIAYTSGGGAFYIPYLIALLFVGFPLLVAEFAVGQGLQASAPKAFANIRRKLEFIGWWAVFTGFVITFYYNVIMGWIWDYLYYALKLAWKSNPKAFFFKQFLHLSSGPGAIDGLRWVIVAGVAITWLSIYLILRKGTESVGETVKWTVPLPIILLLILGLRGITLPGALKGLNYLFQPDFSKLWNIKIWANAFGQIFFSLSLAFGIMIAYGSYNHKKEEIANNALITALGNSATSFLAGIAVFTILGYMAYQMHTTVPKVITHGIGLAFVTYPKAITLLPGGVFAQTIFGILFFIMLLTLGIDSAFSLVEAVEAAVNDKFAFKKETALKVLCVLGFFGSLVFATRAGLYWLDIVDHYVSNYGLLMVGILESVVFGWLLGAEDIRRYVNSVSEIKLGRWFNFSIKYLIPAGLAFILSLSAIDEVSKAYGGYPFWALKIGASVLLATFILAIVFSLVKAVNPSYYKAEKLKEEE